MAGDVDLGSLEAQLVALRAAYWGGRLSVQYEGKQVTYRDSASMREAIASLEAACGKPQGGAVRIITNKGW
jgi:hypothetical protein